ncbi:olfactory receptor 142-like [Oreochromis aureus]|uniref:olfactory receptor 142-like n=1 Tax=Oreochromis aureus TaxID=47969 RepID=UPI0019530B79|nr:olfactory receptor 142-like [Oreochromis aureus]
MDNVSNVRSFILSGFNETVSFKIPLFLSTLVCYCVILFFNISLMLIIVLDENLHEPMYILLSSFCINALYGSTGFYPKFLSDLLTSSQIISHEGCLLQAFIMYSFVCCNSSILAVMAFDRYLAICRPLHYHSFMTNRRLSQLVCFSWLTPFCIFAINVLLTARLKLCGKNIQRVLCLNWLIVKLACPEVNTLSNNITAYATVIIYVSHGFFIIWTYVHLIKTCAKSREDRVKFMQTCVPHMTSLITFLSVVVFQFVYMRSDSTDLPQSLQNFIATEFVIIPPIMIPLIYGFTLTKIRNRILGLVLELVHGSVGAGHYGNAKTLRRLRGQFYWPENRRVLLARDCYRRLRERRQAQVSAGVRQKRACDTRCQGGAFVPGDKVWVYCPVRKRGCPQAVRSLARAAEVVGAANRSGVRIRMPGPGRVAVLHQDRLSPYCPAAPAAARAGDAGGTPGSHPSDSSPAGPDLPARRRKTHGHLQDFVLVYAGRHTIQWDHWTLFMELMAQ